MRILTFKDAIREAQEQCLEDPSVFLIGEGVGDPKNIFGTTTGLKEKFPDRVFDMPISENGVTGICIGASLNGFKPILVHQRIDFSLYSMDQIVNNAAKWFSMFGGQKNVPFVCRMIVGRGWGQGNQHSQNLTALYAHIPGLKIVMPSNARDAKGLFISAVEDPNPVLFIEHRWLYETTSNVPEEKYGVPIGVPSFAKTDSANWVVVASGHAYLEALKAQRILHEKFPIDLIDLRTIKPLPIDQIKRAAKRSGHLLVVEDGWRFGGISAEIIAQVVEDLPWVVCRRITYPDYPSASTPALTKNYYPTAKKIVELFGFKYEEEDGPHDVPDQNFRGPF